MGISKMLDWNFIKGDLIYINKDTLSNIKPTVSNHFLQHVGYAVDVNVIYFNPLLDVKEIKASVVLSPIIQQILKVNQKSNPLSVTETPKC